MIASALSTALSLASAFAAAFAMSACAGSGASAGAGAAPRASESSARSASTRAGDPTLHPPGEPAEVRLRSTEVAWSDTLPLEGLYPKRDLEQRMAFIAACDMSMRARDPGAVEDAKLLAALYSEHDNAASFAEALREEFELVRIESDSVVESGGGADAGIQGAVGASASERVGSGAGPEVASADAAAGKGAGRSPAAPAGLMTGYATPFVEARLVRDERFRFPLFGDLRKSAPELAGSARRAILDSPEARKSVIAWVDDPLLWALVETNGTARLEVPSDRGPREILLSRVATNGRPWTGLGRALAARGLVPAEGATLADVAQAARANPAAAEEAAMANDRVVFFAAVGSNAFPPALGIAGARLVAGYSCAADQSVYPPGSALLVVDAAPDDGRAMPPRLLFVHDAGGAIRGPQRVDAYRGQGTEPLLRAGEMRESVLVYRLTRRR